MVHAPRRVFIGKAALPSSAYPGHALSYKERNAGTSHRQSTKTHPRGRKSRGKFFFLTSPPRARVCQPPRNAPWDTRYVAIIRRSRSVALLFFHFFFEKENSSTFSSHRKNLGGGRARRRNSRNAQDNCEDYLGTVSHGTMFAYRKFFAGSTTFLRISAIISRSGYYLCLCL